VINYAKREIHIIPNKHLRDPFDYSYTGLGIYQVDGRVVVEDVLPGSPGEQAGFRTGDMILAINNDISGNIRIYKQLLQQTGTKLRFLVRNEDGIRVLTMRPARIY
jgi:C-terminal processing protease CtpA/Prc